ncbi:MULTISPECIES: helix-turn-helix domain-containing protein [unclassified Sphingobacterium]|uniref:AlbA family DNA-binding domain-containing protein n=1 Tax=unclassified Sphingobacterium TaxID=2609468 RepID=UPI0025F99B2B|nr:MULTISPECIES: ATP-binding protein [unclassified Sphingobacterium]
MKETIVNLIENESENTKLDFKLEQYPIEKGNIKKGEFLKDMCAFANLISKEDKFIIIGAEEENGIAVSFKSIDNLHDQASYQQFLNQYIEPEINFEYREIIHEGNRLAYFRLFNNNKRPYLFKKEYKDIQPKGNQYKIGSGFVRTGTSTRELKRDDFEKIYTERFSIKDRSDEIEFEITLGGFKFSEIGYTGYIKHLRVDVINLSNSSIDLDVEAKIYNNRGVTALCTQDIEEKYHKDKREKSMFSNTPYLDNMYSPFLRVDLNLEFTKHASYSIYEITPKKGTHTAVRVKQKGVETDIFNDQIALVFSRPSEIKIELIVRSNEFPNGPKTFNYSFSEDQIQEILDPRDL